ncbi:MAG: tyrosine-protein phosphatase [Solirubrobacteraceae bacterium]
MGEGGRAARLLHGHRANPGVRPQPDRAGRDRGAATAVEAGPQFGTPPYHEASHRTVPGTQRPCRERDCARWPTRVVFHCEAGRDQAGQIEMLALALAGVTVA